MCKAFSCIILRNKKAYWKLGLDSHNDLTDKFKLKDDKNYCPIEITPNNNNYIDPDKWTLEFDDVCPDWWKQSHEQSAWSAHKQWLKELNSKIHRTRIKNIILPFNLPMVKKVNKSQIRLLKEWNSVSNLVWNLVWNSVWNSIRDSIWAYTGYMFKLNRKEWKYTDKIKCKGYPFISAVKLWKQGLVPSFDGDIWRLHSGKKAKVVFEISKEDLLKFK